MSPSPNRLLSEVLTDLSTLLQIRKKLTDKHEAHHLVLSLPWTDSLLHDAMTELDDSTPSSSKPQALQNLNQMLSIEDALHKMGLEGMVNRLQIVMFQQKGCVKSVEEKGKLMEIPETPQADRREESVELVSQRQAPAQVGKKEAPTMRMTRSRARRAAARSRGQAVRGGRERK
ncbi:MAG: hypothetical protein Q9208_004155 [Pyrenodesmia sp. 3 TL-2023]